MKATLLGLVSTLWLVVPLLASALVGAAAASARASLPVRRALVAALAVVAALALVDATRMQWQDGRVVNHYEHYHYYLGAKYAAEHAYERLYAAVVVAEAELGQPPLVKKARDLRTMRHVDADKIRARPQAVKRHFTDARWREFVADVAYFKRSAGHLWPHMLLDKGYNGTPVWGTTAGLLAHLVPTSSAVGMQALALLDPLLLAIAFAAMAWAFGVRASLFCFVLLATHMFAAHTHLKAAFLRLDWLAFLLVALALLKKGRPALAGAFTAWAGLLRVFPLVYAFGVGGKLLWSIIDERRLDRRHAAYLVGFAGAVVVLVAASVAYAGGLETWRRFVERIVAHEDAISAWRVGFKYVFLMQYDAGPGSGSVLFHRFERWDWLYHVLQAIALGGVLAAVRRVESWEAQALGFIVAFFLVAPTYYYYAMIVVPGVYFAARLEDPRRAAGLVALYASSILGHWLIATHGRGYLTFWIMSAAMLAVCAYMVVLALRPARSSDARGSDASPLPLLYPPP